MDTETDLYPTSQLFVTIMKYLTQGTYGEKGFIEFQVWGPNGIVQASPNHLLMLQTTVMECKLEQISDNVLSQEQKERERESLLHI